jgi:hypothetical protein
MEGSKRGCLKVSRSICPWVKTLLGSSHTCNISWGRIPQCKMGGEDVSQTWQC